MQSVIKDPQAVLSYGWEWADFGANDAGSTDTGWLQGATIVTSSWSISGPDATLVVDSDTNSATATSVVLSGGTLGGTYMATNHIVTSTGLEDDRSLIVRIQQK